MHFTDIETHPNWWVPVQDKRLDLYANDPGRGVDICRTTTVKTMADFGRRKLSSRKAIADKALTMVGQSALINDVGIWMEASIFAGIQPEAAA